MKENNEGKNTQKEKQPFYKAKGILAIVKTCRVGILILIGITSILIPYQLAPVLISSDDDSGKNITTTGNEDRLL